MHERVNSECLAILCQRNLVRLAFVKIYNIKKFNIPGFCLVSIFPNITAQKMKFFIKDFFSNCGQIVK